MKIKYKNILLYIFAVALISTLLSGCISVARFSDFPKASKDIDFDKYSTEFAGKEQPFWTFETSNEYYLERNKNLHKDDLSNILQTALRETGYRLKANDVENNYMLGFRGMRANEWDSITGIYYKTNEDKEKIQIYIITKITQDITGGWSENRSEEVGRIIEKLIDSK